MCRLPSLVLEAYLTEFLGPWLDRAQKIPLGMGCFFSGAVGTTACLPFGRRWLVGGVGLKFDVIFEAHAKAATGVVSIAAAMDTVVGLANPVGPVTR
jgi:hypothetical protein